MQDIEVPRYNAAKAAFAKAFETGYARGEDEVASGKAKRDDSHRLPDHVDVPRTKVLDDEWQPYVHLFETAGYKAALCSRRRARARLDDSEASPESREANMHNRYRWHVVDPGGGG